MEKTVEQLFSELKADVQRLAAKVEPRLPSVLTREQAARELSIGLTKLKGLIRAGVVGTCKVGDREMIPASEIHRLANPSKPVKRGGGRKARPHISPQQEAQKLRELRKKKRKEEPLMVT